MKFLADESCDFAAVRSLRAAGHDVFAVSEHIRQSDDANLMKTAHRAGRILLTEDKDFGWLAYVAQADSAGVILIRFPASERRSLAESVLSLVDRFGPQLSRAFVVLSPGSVRISFSRFRKQ